MAQWHWVVRGPGSRDVKKQQVVDGGDQFFDLTKSIQPCCLHHFCPAPHDQIHCATKHSLIARTKRTASISIGSISLQKTSISPALLLDSSTREELFYTIPHQKPIPLPRPPNPRIFPSNSESQQDNSPPKNKTECCTLSYRRPRRQLRIPFFHTGYDTRIIATFFLTRHSIFAIFPRTLEPKPVDLSTIHTTD